MQHNGIKHIKCTPYHPSSNGLAERFVRTFKLAMKAGTTNNIPLAHRLADFLLSYRSSTAHSPSYLFLHRELRTRLDLLRPSVANKVMDSQSSQSCQHDKHAKLRTFHIGQLIWAKDFMSRNWIKGVIVEQRGPYTFLIRTV